MAVSLWVDRRAQAGEHRGMAGSPLWWIRGVNRLVEIHDSNGRPDSCV